jgi:ABC-2 type transport system permease protein
VIGALSFYLFRSLVNRVSARVRRLRNPRYLLSALAGLVYMYFAFLRRFTQSPHGGAIPQLPVDPEFIATAEIICSVVLLVLVLAPWFSFARPTALLFTEAEIQFLFPAPISRRTLLRYRIARGQFAILFGVVVSFLVFARPNVVPHRFFLFVTIWVVYSFLGFYRMGASLAKTSLAEHGSAGFRRQLWAVISVVVIVAAIGVWLRWFVAAPNGADLSTAAGMAAWIRRAADAGPARFLLLPFTTLVRPASAGDWPPFLLRLIPSLGILALAYGWVMTSHARFEEASVARAEQMARRLETVRSGVALRKSAVIPLVPFRLRAEGSIQGAFLWKNLISIGRISPWRLLSVLGVVAFAIAISSVERKSFLMVVGAMSGGTLAFLTLLGPVVMRNDLRMDLLHLNVIKSYPVRGWRVVLGEVLAPAVVLTAVEWFLIVITSATLTGMGRVPWRADQRFAFALAAMLLFPFFSFIALLVQNGAALILPAWVHLGRAQQRGIEAMGQRLITMVATMVVLIVAVVPAGVLFAIVYYPAMLFIGYAAVPLAASVSCCALFLEAVAGTALLGRVFDRLDPSAEIEIGN